MKRIKTEIIEIKCRVVPLAHTVATTIMNVVKLQGFVVFIEVVVKVVVVVVIVVVVVLVVVVVVVDVDVETVVEEVPKTTTVATPGIVTGAAVVAPAATVVTVTKPIGKIVTAVDDCPAKGRVDP